MSMSWCYRCMKYAVISVALQFIVWSPAFVALSIYVIWKHDLSVEMEVSPNQEHLVVYGGWISVVVGSLALITGILGCLAAFKKSSAILIGFFMFLLSFWLAWLTAGVSVYMNSDQFFNYFRTLMKDSVQNFYGVEEYWTQLWDIMQRKMQCCGASGFKDYSSKDFQAVYMVPRSCCYGNVSEAQCDSARIIYNNTLSIPGSAKGFASIFQETCADKFIYWTKTVSPYVIGALFGIGFDLLLCLFFSAILVYAYWSRRHW